MPDTRIDLTHSSSASGIPGKDAAGDRLMFALGVLKWTVLLLVLACPYISAFLIYPLPSVSSVVSDLQWTIWLLLFFFTVSAVFCRRWVQTFFLVIAWAWVLFEPPLALKPMPWLVAKGFQVHAGHPDAYLSTCELFHFTEGGTERTFGVCEGQDRGPAVTGIYYDPTGEIALPLSERTPEWRQAMEQRITTRVLLEPNVVGREFNVGVQHFFDHFYEVGVPMELMRGG